MRKVFISVALLGELKPTTYVSEDYCVEGKNFNFPITYLIDDAVEHGDEVEVITVVEQSEGDKHLAKDNYAVLQEEVKQVVADRNVKLNFTEVATYSKFDSLTFNHFFKDIALLVKSQDIIYMDITFGMKPYNLSMFIAVSYAAQVAEQVLIENVIYAMKYNGTDVAKDVNTSKLYDLTGLFYLNRFANNAIGNKESMDKMLTMLISD